MGLVKLGDQVMPDRRTNGARIKLDIGDWIKITTMIIVVILGWGRLQWTVNDVSKVLERQVATITTNTLLIRDNIKDIQYLKNSFIKIDDKLDKLLER